jgi:hypothetical protein
VDVAMVDEKPKQKGWKEHFLRSGVPLEYQVALLMAAEDMAVDADFSFIRRDVGGFKEWSVDILAEWYGPTSNNLKYELNALVECKYRSPEKCVLFLEEPNDQFSPVTLGGTVSSFDTLVPYHLWLNAFVSLEEKLPYVYKGIELHDKGAFDEDFRHGIQQLRYATPAVLRRALDHGLYGHYSEALAIFVTRILVTNAPLRILNRGADIKAIREASNLDEISHQCETVILYSDSGPDFEDHFRLTFESGTKDRLEAAQSFESYLAKAGKKFGIRSDPVNLIEGLSKAQRFECLSVGRQFFVTTLDGLRPLLNSLKHDCREAYRQRTKGKPNYGSKRRS